MDQINGNRFSGMTFDTRDVAPLRYAAFAFALGAVAGLLMRRTIPATAVTLAVFIGIQILVPAAIRPNLLPSTTVTFAMNRPTLSQPTGIYGGGPGADGGFYIVGLSVPQGAWVLSTSPVERSSGEVVTMITVQACLPGPDRNPGENPFAQFGACVASDNLHETVAYEPAKNYWPMQ
jgi:hypothetical protein